MTEEIRWRTISPFSLTPTNATVEFTLHSHAVGVTEDGSGGPAKRNILKLLAKTARMKLKSMPS